MSLRFRLIFFFLILFFLCGTLPLQASHQSQPGWFDLKDYDFSSRPAMLRGLWEFYWADFVPPNALKGKGHPSFWGFAPVPGNWARLSGGSHPVQGTGFATYRARLRLPKKRQDYTLRFSMVSSSFRLFVDGKLLFQNGYPAQSSGETVAAFRTRYIQFSHAGGAAEILVQVANFDHYKGGIRVAPQLGLAQDMAFRRYKALGFDFLLIGSIGFMALYHLIIYLLRREEPSTLYFSLFCFALGVRALFMNEQPIYLAFPHLDSLVSTRIELIGGFIAAPAVLNYFRYGFCPHAARWWYRFYEISSAIYILAVLVLPLQYSTFGVLLYQIGIVLGLPYLFLLWVRIWREGNRDILIFALGNLVFILCFINDFLYYNELIATTDLIPTGLFVFLFSQTFVLALHNAKAYRSLEQVSETVQKQALQTQILHQALESRFEAQTKDLQASEERYRHLVELAPLPIALLVEGYIVFANHATLQLLQLTSRDLPRGIRLSEFASGESQDLLQDELSNCLKTQKPLLALEAQFSIGKHKLPIELSAAAVTLAGKPALLLLLRNIQEQKNYEESLQKAKSLAEEAVNTKSEFLATMSHELRTPLNGVISMAFYLQETPLNVDQQEGLQILTHSAETLLSLINDLLDFSRLEAGKDHLESEPTALTTFVTDCVNGFDLKAKAKGIALQLSIDPACPQVILIDKNKLRQILLNFIGNAVKFTPQGQVEIRVELAPAIWANPSLSFEVIDTGVGIAEADQTRIFEPFEQVDSSSRREYGGTGLGLAICKRLINALGGEFTLISALGKGSRFAFTVPYEEVEEQEEQSKPQKKIIPDFSHLNILIVEDDLANQAILKKLLSATKAKFACSSHGAQALACLQKNKFDLILMDLAMPVMDGITTTRMIRQGKEGVLQPNLPILAVTAHVLPSAREECLAAGMSGFLSKPVTGLALYQAISKLFSIS